MNQGQIAAIRQLKSEGKTLVEIASQVGLEIGDVQTAVSIVEIVAQAGPNGLVRKVEFPFAYDTPGLTDGVHVFTPKVGDLLLNAWVEVDEAWDGTTPHADIGTFISPDTHGIFGNIIVNSPVGLAAAAEDSGGLLVPYAGGVLSLLSLYPGGSPRFISEDPLKLVVSQDGTLGGASPASTQGAGTLWLLVL